MTHRNLHWYRVTCELDSETENPKTVHITVEAGNEEYAALEAKATYNGKGLREKSDVKIVSVEQD
jgi:hypothetical protein